MTTTNHQNKNHMILVMYALDVDFDNLYLVNSNIWPQETLEQIADLALKH